jgi:hypothetical protein
VTDASLVTPARTFTSHVVVRSLADFTSSPIPQAAWPSPVPVERESRGPRLAAWDRGFTVVAAIICVAWRKIRNDRIHIIGKNVSASSIELRWRFLSILVASGAPPRVSAPPGGGLQPGHCALPWAFENRAGKPHNCCLCHALRRSVGVANLDVLAVQRGRLDARADHTPSVNMDSRGPAPYRPWLSLNFL